MPTHIAGVTCPDCPQVVDIPVDINDIYDTDGTWLDISIEVDMRPWTTHHATHQSTEPDARRSYRRRGI